MKTLKPFTLIFAALLCAVSSSAQSADEIISKYIQAIGGKEKLSTITSVYTESTMDVMGMQGTIKTTTLNGKGIRQDMDIMGSIISTCYTDKGGWSLNPMTGSYSAEAMPEQQYNSGKDQIHVGGQFLDYAEKEYTAELLGTDTVANVAAFKVRMIQPDSTSALYFFDSNTFFLVYSIQQSEMQGQMIDNVMTFSDYKEVEGYFMPYKIDMDMAGGQFTMAMTVTKVELNKPVNDTIFAMP